jgi:hypothetical protein
MPPVNNAACANPGKDFAPIGLISSTPIVIMAHASFAPKTIGGNADGGDGLASTPAEYAADRDKEAATWVPLIRKLGLRVE